MIYSAITDTGRRSNNEDCVMVNGEIISQGVLSGSVSEKIIAVVCDGVGGYSHGEEASRMTAETFSKLSGKFLTQNEIEFAINEANENILNTQKKMATTIAGIYICENNFIAFNVGDTKVFRYRNSYLTLLSTDHTVAQEASDLGIDVCEGDKNKITRCVGDKNICKPSIVSGENRIFSGDVFLICSDGFIADIDETEKMLSERTNLNELCENFLALALKNGSTDNISIVLLEVD